MRFWELGVENWEFRGRRPRLVGHVEEESRRPTALRHDALALLGRFPRLFAVLAANRERQRPQARLGDLVAALEAIAVGALVEAAQSRIDLVERLGLHLDERELDVLLDVDL
jgi:hypothetical protein